VDRNNNLNAGHGRLLAACKFGISKVPVVAMIYLTDTQSKALILANKKIAENTSWDDELLGLEISELQKEGFDLDLTSFIFDEWDVLIRIDVLDKTG